MVYKSKQTWKDLVEPCSHSTLSRRELLTKGLFTGSLSLGMSRALMGDLIRHAHAAPANCPVPVRNPGCIAQIFSEGGPTMGARFISEKQLGLMNATMAKNYGISGQSENLRKLGPNLVIDITSPFGATLLQGPNGFPGGATAWQNTVLSRISGGGHLGPFNADDGAGVNSGLVAGVSPFKSSSMGKDLKIGVTVTSAKWAIGLPSASIKGNTNLAPASFSEAFSMTPAATDLVTESILNKASDTANSLGQILGSLFGTSHRKGYEKMQAAVHCGIYGNAALANPNYGSMLFNPQNHKALTNIIPNIAALSNPEKAFLAAYYQSAVGVAGGVAAQFNGRDYHGGDPGTRIAPADIEEARAIVMFLAACHAAQAPGSMIYLSNGQAIADGVKSVTATIGGSSLTLNAPVAKGDAGGAYNAGLIIFYQPDSSKAPPMALMTGTIDNSGNAKTDPNVGTSNEAVAGLYLSALAYINNGNVPQSALTTMQNSGVASNPKKTMVLT